MRKTALLVLVLGLALVVGGLAVGLASLASWNGRNTVLVLPVELGSTREATFAGRHGRRYWVGAQAQLDRAEGAPRPAFKMPLVLALRDEEGTNLLTAAGWFDPEESPTALFGNLEGAPGAGPIVAERLLGPYPVKTSQPLRALVEIGPDRVGTAHVSSLRVVVYDDGLPPSLAAPFAVAGLGGLACVLSLGLFLASVIRRLSGAGPAKRGAST